MLGTCPTLEAMDPSALDQVRALLEIEAPVERMRALRQRREQFDTEFKELLGEFLRSAGADETDPETWGKLDTILSKARALTGPP